MPNTVIRAVASFSLLPLALVGLALGCGAETGQSPPPAPRTAEELARDAEIHGEIRGRLIEINPVARAERLAAYLQGLGPEAAPQVARTLEASGIGIGPADVAVLVHFWGLHEPAAASEWAIRKSHPGLRHVAVDAALEAHGTVDPQGALEVLAEYIRSVAGSPFEVNAHAGLTRGWYASGRPGLVEWIHALGPDIPQQRALSNYAQLYLMEHGSEALMERLEDWPEDDHRFKRAAFRQGIEVLARQDPEQALAWCERICSGPYGEHTLAIGAKTWALQDGKAALEWLAARPIEGDGDEHARAMRAVFQNWRQSDQAAVLDWIYSMSPDDVEPWLVPIVDRIATLISWDYPLEAFAWAAHIPDEEYRERTYISISRRYREVDEEGAERWLLQSSLSEEAREKARTFPPRFKRRGNRPWPPPPRPS